MTTLKLSAFCPYNVQKFSQQCINKTMNSFLRNTISKLYNAVSVPVAATRGALAERLQRVRDITSLLYKRVMENMGYRQQEGLKDIVEKEADEEEQPTAAKEEEEEGAKEQQQDDDDEQYDMVAKIKLVHEGKRVNIFRVTGNLSRPNTNDHGQHHITY